MADKIPDNWSQCSSSEIFYLFVNPDILANDAIFLEEMITLSFKTYHRQAAHNQAKKDATSEATRKACAEFWADCEKHWKDTLRTKP